MWSLSSTLTTQTAKLYFNTTFVHVEQAEELAFVSGDGDFNTTFVHVEQTTYTLRVESLIFQYNICTCGAFGQTPQQKMLNLFQYNICTCGANSKYLLWL